MRARLISLIFTLCLAALPYFRTSKDPSYIVSIHILAVCIFPLACIWFSDAMGNYTDSFRSPAINKTTPGPIVALAGWIFLFMILIVMLLPHS